jgi:hypothetical protein
MLATPTAGLLPSARLLLPRAIRGRRGSQEWAALRRYRSKVLHVGVPAGALRWDRRSLRSRREIEAAR